MAIRLIHIMRWRQHRVAAVAVLASSIEVLLAVPAFPQSNSESPRDIGNAIGAGLGRTGSDVVRVYVGSHTPPADVAAYPENLDVSRMYRPLIESMLRRSPTFRRQCLRIANAPGLTVRLSTFHPLASERLRARTRLLAAPNGRIHAVVQIAPLDDQAELIAHEIEHVIEQLDGVNLRSRALLPTSGVTWCDDGAFETMRAVRVGLAVSREVQSAGR